MLLLWSPLQSAEKKVPKLVVCDSWQMVAVTHWSRVIQDVALGCSCAFDHWDC